MAMKDGILLLLLYVCLYAVITNKNRKKVQWINLFIALIYCSLLSVSCEGDI